MSRTRAADDFAAIGARLRELDKYPPAGCSCEYAALDGELLRITDDGCPHHSPVAALAADRAREETEGLG